MKPRFIISRSRAIEQYHKLRQLGLQVSYSVKTNPVLIRILEPNTDASFSIHSLKNVELVEDKSRVWFFPQGWNKKLIKELVSLGVRRFVVDNENDLRVLLDAQANDIDLMLRMRLKEHTIFTGRYFVFGMPAAAINEWLPKLRRLGWIKKLGIHFHRKSQNVSEWRLTDELRESINKETLNAADIVDIGGGFPARYKNTSDAIMKHIVKDIKELKAWLSRFGIAIVAEPGRFIAAPAGKLVVKIVNMYEKNIVVNCSVYSGAMDTLVVPIKLLVKGELDTGEAYTIKGISPCSLDIFRYRVYLKKPRVGDMITFLNAGAYNYYSDFCNLERPETIIVE